jgi:hypothetical protein
MGKQEEIKNRERGCKKDNKSMAQHLSCPPCVGVGFDATICCGWGGMDESKQQVIREPYVGKSIH